MHGCANLADVIIIIMEWLLITPGAWLHVLNQPVYRFVSAVADRGGVIISHVNFTACNRFIGGNCLPHICAVSSMICYTYIKIAIELILGGICP